MRLIDADVLPPKYCGAWENSEEIIKRAPTVDAAPIKHGHWICTNIAYGQYKCSVCDGLDSNCDDYYSSHYVLDQEYCPWCGAKMDERTR